MRKKSVIVLLVSCLIVICGYSIARPVQAFSYKKMASDADLVVIASPVEVKVLDEITDLPGIRRGNEPIKVVGLETTFEVSVLFQGKLDKAQKSKILLHHYRLTEPQPEIIVNGPGLVNFKPADRSQYLMFLKRAADGRYEPYNGQTDPDLSIEKLRNTLL